MLLVNEFVSSIKNGFVIKKTKSEIEIKIQEYKINLILFLKFFISNTSIKIIDKGVATIFIPTVSPKIILDRTKFLKLFFSNCFNER